jgi:hypothetical protein
MGIGTDADSDAGRTGALKNLVLYIENLIVKVMGVCH